MKKLSYIIYLILIVFGAFLLTGCNDIQVDGKNVNMQSVDYSEKVKQVAIEKLLNDEYFKKNNIEPIVLYVSNYERSNNTGSNENSFPVYVTAAYKTNSEQWSIRTYTVSISIEEVLG